MKTESVTTRELMPSEWPFVYQTWLRSYFREVLRKGLKTKEQQSEWSSDYHGIIERILTTRKTKGAFAGDELLSYLVYELTDKGLRVHYVYTKGPFRGFGLAKRLVREALRETKGTIFSWTHETRKWRETAGLGFDFKSRYFRKTHLPGVAPRRS